MKIFILLPIIFLVSCGWTGPRWSNSKLPRTILVPQDKYYQYKHIFDEVEDDYQNAVDGKDIIDFKPTDKSYSWDEGMDVLKAPRSGSQSYLFFKESADEYADMGSGTLGTAYSRKFGNLMLQGNIVLNFHNYYNSFFSKDAVFKDILLHEVGHILGFGHIDDPTSIMNPYESRTTGLSDLDQTAIYNNYILEQISNMYKDLEKMGARIETKDLEKRSLELALSYGLSDERSMEVARALTHMESINSKRSLTGREKDLLTQELIGLNYSVSKNAMEKLIQGDEQGMEDLLEKAAEKNGITPEHVGDLLTELIKLN